MIKRLLRLWNDFKRSTVDVPRAAIIVIIRIILVRKDTLCFWAQTRERIKVSSAPTPAKPEIDLRQKLKNHKGKNILYTFIDIYRIHYSHPKSYLLI